MSKRDKQPGFLSNDHSNAIHLLEWSTLPFCICEQTTACLAMYLSHKNMCIARLHISAHIVNTIMHPAA